MANPIDYKPGVYKFVAMVDPEMPVSGGDSIVLHPLSADCPDHKDLVPAGFCAVGAGSILITPDWWSIMSLYSQSLNLNMRIVEDGVLITAAVGVPQRRTV